MAKYSFAEREFIKSLIAAASIKRLTDKEIIEDIQKHFPDRGAVTRNYLTKMRTSIKKQSYQWFNEMRQGKYDYIHTFRERMNEIIDLQKWHQNIINDNKLPISVKQVSAIELHKLNLSLANYLDVLPSIIGSQNNATISTASKELSTNDQQSKQSIIV